MIKKLFSRSSRSFRSKVLISLMLPVTATAASAAPAVFSSNDPVVRHLPDLAEKVSAKIMEEFKDKKLKPEDWAFTFIDLQDLDHPAEADFRADVPIYPASVVKMFYLVAVHRWLEDGKIQDSPELRRAMRDMVIPSSNDATGLIVDMLTDTTSGPEMTPEALKEWQYKRNAMNRYFSGLGFTNINVNQKTWNEAPYGREEQGLGPQRANRNRLTTQACAQLITQIALGQIVTKPRCQEMMDLMKRNIHYGPNASELEKENTDFIGPTIRAIPGSQMWAKAGWTDTARHDCVYVELPVSAQYPKGARFAMSVFTTGHAYEAEIIPEVARTILEMYYGKAG